VPEIGLGVDWTTILLQALNFLILLVILQRFLYRPLRSKMREREAEIESEIAAAERRAAEAEREREELEERLEAATTEAEEIRREAREEAAARREEILEKARGEAADIRQEATERVRREERAARERIRKDARRTAVELTKDLLRETGGKAVHDRLVERFLRGEDDLGEADLDRLADAVRRAGGAVRVRTAYPMEADELERLREALLERLPREDESAPPAIEFSVEEDPELVAGLSLLSGGVAVDLNVKHALEEYTGETTGADDADEINDADDADEVDEVTEADEVADVDVETPRNASIGESEDERGERARPQENGGEEG